MREIRPSGSEGGAAQINAPSLPLSVARASLPAAKLLARGLGYSTMSSTMWTEGLALFLSMLMRT